MSFSFPPSPFPSLSPNPQKLTHLISFAAFIVGLINTNYAFACLDCATHLAEELPNPSRAIPIAILGTVAIGFVTAWTYSIALFFSIKDLDAIFDTETLVPLLELFYQAIGNKGGAIVLEALVVATGVWCLVACHTWQSRLCWSFARDGGVPASGLFERVERSWWGKDVPVAAHGVSSFLVGCLGLLYLGSSTAFYSMVTACIVLLYISYSIPVVCLLIRGRDNIKHGPFWMGKFGLVSNVVLLVWTLFTLVMYSFPVYYPAESGSEYRLSRFERQIADGCDSYELRLCCLRYPRRHCGTRLVLEREEALQRPDCSSPGRCGKSGSSGVNPYSQDVMSSNCRQWTRMKTEALAHRNWKTRHLGMKVIYKHFSVHPSFLGLGICALGEWQAACIPPRSLKALQLSLSLQQQRDIER